MKSKDKPIAVSMGEPSGISSEIVIKAWLRRNTYNLQPFILVDDINKLKKINKLFKLNATFYPLSKDEDASKIFSKAIPVVDLNESINFKLGEPDSKNSKFVIKSINKALTLVLNKEASGMITLPVCKKTLKKASFNFNGQTEYLAYRTMKKIGKKQSEIMILSTTQPIDKGKNLIVGLVTTHIPLSLIHKKIKRSLVQEKILSFNNALKTIWKINSPVIGITGINPHAGEGGLIGSEEKKIVLPLLEDCKRKKIKIIGPLSSDSCFHKSIREKFDGILCFYHDQGLIPVKTLDFHNSVNVTGGLPFIRVSPDHGPAFDIAKKNIAHIDSLIAAFKFLKKVV